MPLTLSAIGVGAAIAGPVIGGLVGQQTSAANRAAAQQAAQAALDQINKLNAPPDLSKQIILEQFKQAGLYTPQMEQDINASFDKIQNSPQGKAALDAQMNGLKLLQERAATGFSAQDRATLNQIRQQAAIDQQGKLAAIKQNMQARGLAGSGSELAQELAAASASGASESANADQVAAQAQQAALQAAIQSGQLGGNINAQQFGQQQANTNITNAERQFNTQNAIARQQRNVSSANQAQAANLANAQSLANANTSQTNAEAQREAAAQRQYWQDQAALAGMKSNALLGQANNLNTQANQNAASWQGIGSGIGAGAAAGVNALANYNKNNKQSTPGSPDYSLVESPNIYGESGDQTANGQYLTDTDNQARFSAFGGYIPYTRYSKGGIVPKQYEPQDCPPGYADGGQVGHMFTRPLGMTDGGNVPGKAPVEGDSFQNDVIHALLSPGEIVIPKTVVEHGPEAGYGFLHAILNKHKQVKKGKV